MYRNYKRSSCPCNCNENDNIDDNNECNEMYQQSCNIYNNNYQNDGNSCSCGYYNDQNMFPEYLMYGHSYVPHQYMNNVYTPEIGLKMGTIFPELVSPYCPNQSMEVINYLKKSNTIGEGCNS